MEKKAKLPVGIENFEKLRTENFYYVDKTGLIKELLDNWGEVNLFTRPGRFGKSLNMNMLRYFFEYGCRAEIFDGLEISKEKSYCEKYMGKFPVISITLKGVDARDFEGAKDMLRSIIGDEAMRFQFLLESGKLTDEEKERYQRLIAIDPNGQRQFAMSDNALTDSLRTLCRLLCKHYGQKVILLIDEYDVPLDKAQQSGCYDEMVSLIRGLFGQALKTNDSLYFAVLTGCLRIAKESIFTGLNNFNIFSVTDVFLAIILALLTKKLPQCRNTMGWLINLTSLKTGMMDIDLGCRMSIVHGMSSTIAENCGLTGKLIQGLFGLIPAATTAAAVEAQFGAYLRRTISIWDTAVRKNRKENFYHGILLGLLGHREDWIVTSNAESGDGYSDILVELAEEGIGIVTEVKYAEEGLLEAACTEALVQIARMDYDARLRQDGMDTIIRYRKGHCSCPGGHQSGAPHTGFWVSWGNGTCACWRPPCPPTACSALPL